MATPDSRDVKRFEPAELGSGHSDSKIRYNEFNPKNLIPGQKLEYKDVKQKFGSLASTDQEHTGKSTKAASFQLHPDSKRLLGVESEERGQVAEVIRAEVEAKINDLREAAKNEGYEEGLKLGKEEAMIKCRAEAASHFAKFKTFLDSAEGMKSELWAANERVLIDLIFQISRQVLLRELKTDREYVVRLAKEVIERVGIREHVKLRVGPEDFAEIENLKSNLNAQLGEMKNLQILLSDDLGAGGCKVESELTEVNASIEKQFELVRKSLSMASDDTANGNNDGN